MTANPSPSGESPAGLKRALPVLGLLTAAWSVIPPYARDIGTEPRIEIADHVVPAVVLVAVSALALWMRSARNRGTLLFIAGLVVLLAGLWMTATHVPLLAQARRHEVASGDAWFHTIPGLAVLALGFAWAAAYWSDAAPPQSATSATEEPADGR